MRFIAAASLVLLLVSQVFADSKIEGDLARAANRPLESYPGVDVVYGVLKTEDGARLRTITTYPAGTSGRMPAILYVQWLSCDTVELPPDQKDGWSLMQRRLLTESGRVVMRTDKAGVGDSTGFDCSKLDYDTELRHHRAALQQLLANPRVDPHNVVIFGASMGATMAPLVAQGVPVRGIAVWGGGARSWFERMVAFDRRAMELSGLKPERITAAMLRHIEFHTLYLLRGMTPEAIAGAEPLLAAVWKEIVGTDGVLHYGRPLSFHQQAQKQDWAAAWGRIDAPVLALLGEYDWFEEPRSAELIARIANRRQVGQGEFHLIPGLDHNFVLYPSAEAAFAEQGGGVQPDAAVDLLLAWLKKIG